MSRSFDGQTARFLAVVFMNMPQNISADVMQDWIDNPRKLQDALREVLCPSASKSEMSIWKTIKIGTGIQSDAGFCSELKKKGFRIGGLAQSMLKQKAFTVATHEEDVDLVNVSVADLGFRDGAQHQWICAKALELGLELCPAEVGPQLRLQYLDQPSDESLVIAMEPINESHNTKLFFRVRRDRRGGWLAGGYGDPDVHCRAKKRFVFRLPRK